MDGKACTLCKEWKQLRHFHRDSRKKSGHRARCKTCTQNQAKLRHKITCEYCGSESTGESKDAKFCSNDCKFKANDTRVRVNCTYCDKEKKVQPYYARINTNHYCNPKCQANHRKIIYKGKGSPRYNKAKKKCDGCEKEIKLHPSVLEIQEYHFCSYDCYKNNIGQYFTGKNHPRYNEELTESERLNNRDYPDYNKWRIEVFERDHYTCKCCGDNKGGNLQAHHIYNYSEHKDIRTDVKNGITLCKKCHKEFHDSFGYANNNEQQLKIYLKQKSAI